MAAMTRTSLPLLLAALLLAGCSSLKNLANLLPFVGPSKARVDQVRVVAMPGANGDLPTRVDLVFVYDAEFSAPLPRSAADWFAQKDALLGAWPGKLEALSLQLPPGSAADPAPLPARHGKAYRVLAYADTQAAAGQPAWELTPFERPLLTIEAGGVRLADAPR